MAIAPERLAEWVRPEHTALVIGLARVAAGPVIAADQPVAAELLVVLEDEGPVSDR